MKSKVNLVGKPRGTRQRQSNQPIFESMPKIIDEIKAARIAAEVVESKQKLEEARRLLEADQK